MDYAALKAADPGGDLASAAAALLAETVEVTRLVERGVMRQAFDNMASAQGVPVWEAIEAARDAQTPLGMACRAALRLRDAPGDYPAVNMSSPALTAMVALLVDGGALSAEQQTAFLALGVITISRAAQLGCSDLTRMDIASAEYHLSVARAL
jgi:hypothetical protein